LAPSSEPPPLAGGAVKYATNLIECICRHSALPASSSQVGVSSPDLELRQIVRSRNTPALFDRMVEIFNYQGISDRVAASYLESHGSITWRQIERQIGRDPVCDLLGSYWAYENCRYDKTRQTCSHPGHFSRCPLPEYPLRNGRLNQTAFSFFLFARDVAGSDLIRWIDNQLSTATELGYPSAQEALIGPMRHVFGVSDKVLTMTLSSVLMADRKQRPDWFAVGSEMIVVDRLVHNLLVRTGILARLGADHPYGPSCYGHNGCAAILRRVSAKIDAQQFDPKFPANFPRYIQHALWRYCAADELDVCNGNNIDDPKSCEYILCIVYSKCGKVALKSK
jgi:hypothetical protein